MMMVRAMFLVFNLSSLLEAQHETQYHPAPLGTRRKSSLRVSHLQGAHKAYSDFTISTATSSELRPPGDTPV